MDRRKLNIPIKILFYLIVKRNMRGNKRPVHDGTKRRIAVAIRLIYLSEQFTRIILPVHLQVLLH